MFVCLLPKALRPPAWFLVMPGLLYVFFFFFFYVDVNRYISYSHKLFKMKKILLMFMWGREKGTTHWKRWVILKTILLSFPSNQFIFWSINWYRRDDAILADPPLYFMQYFASQTRPKCWNKMVINGRKLQYHSLFYATLFPLHLI